MVCGRDVDVYNQGDIAFKINNNNLTEVDSYVYVFGFKY